MGRIGAVAQQPSGVVPHHAPLPALQRAPQRRCVHVAPRGDAQHNVVPAAAPRSSIAASETFEYQPGPTYGNRFRQNCLALQQPSTKPRSGSTPSTGSTPSAGHRMGRGKGALASPLRLQRTTFSNLWAARSLSASSRLWQSPHSACKICTLPAKRPVLPAHVVQLAVPAQPHSAHLPSCAARFFCLSPAPGTSRFAFSSF